MYPLDIWHLQAKSALDFSNKMGWIHPLSWALNRTIKVFKVSTVKRALSSDLAIFFLLPLGRGAWCMACVRVYFQYHPYT